MRRRVSERYIKLAEMLPILEIVQDQFEWGGVSRDIEIFKLYCSGQFTHHELGEKFGGISGVRVTQILKKIENEINKFATKQVIEIVRQQAIFKEWCVGKSSINSVAAKFSVTPEEVADAIKIQSDLIKINVKR